MVNEYNEISYAEKMIKNGFLTKKRTYELCLLAKYYIHLGMKPSSVKENLLSFCIKNIDDFNEVKYFDKINSVLNSSKKTPIVELGSIPITDTDIEFIDSFEENKDFNSVLFSIITIKKIRELLGQQSYLNIKDSKLARMSGLHRTNDLFPVIRRMIQFGLLRLCRTGNCEITFSLQNGKTVINVNDVDSCYGYYRNYKNLGKYIECSECGKVIKKVTNNQVYCRDCAKKKQFLQKKAWDKKNK